MRVITLLAMMPAASLLFASMTSLANAGICKENYKGEALPRPCPIIMLKDGLYAGAAAGIDSFQMAEKANFTNGDTYTAHAGLNTFGGAIGVFVGYGKYFPRFRNAYLGAEIFANGSSAKTDWDALRNINGVTTELNTETVDDSNYGISLLPGIKLNPNTLAYVRLGYNWANLSLNERFIVDGDEVVHSHSHTTRGGFNYGLGAESAFYNRWSARIEYTHTDYSSFTTHFGTKVNSQDNQFMLGMIYHLDYDIP